jgi:hypothetical protein
MTLASHPFAELFPPLNGDAFLEFVEDIRENGIRDQIVTLNDQILDGRNRFNALRYLTESGELLGEGWGHRKGEALFADALDPPQGWFCNFNQTLNGEPLAWVLSKNLARRHLTDDQRRMIAARLVNMKQGRPADDETSQVANITRERAAQLLAADIPGVDRARSVLSHADADVVAAVDEGKLSVSAASSIAKLPAEEQPAALAQALPKGHRAIMGSRQEPDDSLDFFPTPPWATRALIERVFPHLDARDDCPRAIAWEPACGEGHMAEVLREYFSDVHATDIRDYGYGEHIIDFLNCRAQDDSDWIITNPPFGDNSEKFVLRALDLARVGVAMFVRLQWLETNGRYERIFRDNPPTLIAFFAERVNLCKGRWEPEGSTATAYIWLVWIKGAKPQAPFWIPPRCREALTRPDDAERFTQKPVQKSESLANAVAEAAVTDGPPGPPAETVSRIAACRSAVEAMVTTGLEAEALNAELQGGQRPESVTDGETSLDLPSFLKRDADNAAPFAKGAAA